MSTVKATAKAQILIVEDEPEIAELIEFHAERAGMRARTIHSGRLALEVMRREKPDLIVLDLMLPDVDGLEICRRLKQSEDTRSIPIVMVTAKGEEADIVAGIELGAEDYVTKPFSARELSARIRAVLRRGTATPPPVGQRLLKVGEAEIDLEGQRIMRGGSAVHVKPKAFQLLAFLIQNAGRVYSREQLLDRVWGYDYAGETRTVDVHMHALRQAIEAIPAQPTALQTVRNIGYVLRRSA